VSQNVHVAFPARDRETVEAFEAMTLGFLPRVDPATLAAVARLVAPCPDTPDSVLVALAQGSSEAQGLLAREAPRLPPEVVDLLLGTESGRPSLAARPDLDARTIGRLLVLNEDAVDLALAANPALDPTQSSFAVLIERARERPALAHALLTRRDLTLSDEAALYLHADAERRAEIRHRIAASALFHRSPAPRLRGRDAERLIALAREGDVPAFEDGLTAALRLPPATAWRLLESGRAELLALALAALGMDEEDAMRIFLTLHPALAHSVATVFALVLGLLVADAARAGRAAGTLVVLGLALAVGGVAGWAQASLGAHYPTDTVGGFSVALALFTPTALAVDHLVDRWNDWRLALRPDFRR
jgi:hypothetical protein